VPRGIPYRVPKGFPYIISGCALSGEVAIFTMGPFQKGYTWTLPVGVAIPQGQLGRPKFIFTLSGKGME